MDFIKITLMYKDKPQGSYIDHTCNVDLIDMMDGADPDSEDWYKLEAISMTDDEFKALPEFMGF